MSAASVCYNTRRYDRWPDGQHSDFDHQWKVTMRLPAGSELLIILGIVILVFGVGRLGRLGGELGSAIKNFREGLGAGMKDDKDAAATTDKPSDKPEETKVI
jgi:TatA/E family protein of Tat protein translocase